MGIKEWKMLLTMLCHLLINSIIYLNLSMVVTLASADGKVRTRPLPLVSFFLLFFVSLREAGVSLPRA